MGVPMMREQDTTTGVILVEWWRKKQPDLAGPQSRYNFSRGSRFGITIHYCAGPGGLLGNLQLSISGFLSSQVQKFKIHQERQR